MINENVLNFLIDLENNNNREWFHKNKGYYEQARTDFELLVNHLIHELQQFDDELSLLTAKDCIFRIYRDVRFSKDKSPYKNNMGAYFVRGGKKSGFAGYYLHIEPGKSFVAGGIHRPSSEILRRVRSEIFSNIEEFKSIIREKRFFTHFNEIEGERLKTAPAGYPKDFPDIDLLKYKSYTVFMPLENQLVVHRKFLQKIVPVFKTMQPFIKFLNRVIG